VDVHAWRAAQHNHLGAAVAPWLSVSTPIQTIGCPSICNGQEKIALEGWGGLREAGTQEPLYLTLPNLLGLHLQVDFKVPLTRKHVCLRTCTEVYEAPQIELEAAMQLQADLI